MGNDLNLKTTFSADTKDLTRGAKQAKQDLKDFGKTSSEVTSSIADAFGVNSQKLTQLSNATRELGNRMAESGNAGVKAFGSMLSGINAVTTAIAGIGIGAAISSFKLLNAEAENFKNTVAGANIELQTQAYVSTYQQVMHDFNAETGQSVAQFESNWKKTTKRIGTDLKQAVVGTLTDTSFSGWDLLGTAGSVAGNLFSREARQQRREALSAAEQAEKISGQMFETTRQLQAKSVEWARTEAQISEYRRIAADDSYTLAQQQEAIAAAISLTEQKAQEEYTLRNNLVTLQKQMSDLASDSTADEDQYYSLQIQAENVMRQKDQTLKSLQKTQKSLNKEASAEAEARRQAAAAAEAQRQAMEASRQSLASLDLSVSEGASSSLIGKANTMEIGAIIKPTYDPKEITDISKELASLVESSITGVSESIGSLIGDLATGGDAWTNFANNAMSSFGDMAIAVGKMAVSTGVATLGIKAALESLNGAVAIAAGAALIALGTAVKMGMSNIASGNYSAGSTVAPASYGSTAVGGGYSGSSLKIEVSGKLTANGRDLEYVLGQENNRKNTVT